jgi:hypothetical protein
MNDDDKTRNGRLIQLCLEPEIREGVKIYAKSNLLQLQTVFERAMWWLTEERKLKRILYRASPKRGVILNIVLSWSMIEIVNALSREDNVHRRSVIFTGLMGFLENEGVIKNVKNTRTIERNDAQSQHHGSNEEGA